MNDNTGHGHVWKRPDGARARCGGPGLCSQCSRDKAMCDLIKRREQGSGQSALPADKEQWR
jgi:hypothetical protein